MQRDWVKQFCLTNIMLNTLQEPFILFNCNILEMLFTVDLLASTEETKATIHLHRVQMAVYHIFTT